MFRHIMVPVDLAERDSIDFALGVACDLARHYDARITLVSVSGGLQGKISHWHEEYGRQLADFAAELGDAHGVRMDSINYGVPDPSVEVDQLLIRAITELEVDLAVIGSHQPGWVEYIVNSHGGRLASHAPISVFVVRDAEPPARHT